jgi:hypothetical protein
MSTLHQPQPSIHQPLNNSDLLSCSLVGDNIGSEYTLA